MPYSKSQKRATIKWMDENYDKIYFSAPKGFNDKLTEYCKKIGMSKRAFIIQTLEEKMKEQE